uniref:Secreted protein n=1 Tax=Zea mays TaxID=4577 RepID=B4FYS3_MAIZE|nr:unknown [Zea mays]
MRVEFSLIWLPVVGSCRILMWKGELVVAPPPPRTWLLLIPALELGNRAQTLGLESDCGYRYDKYARSKLFLYVVGSQMPRADLFVCLLLMLMF